MTTRSRGGFQHRNQSQRRKTAWGEGVGGTGVTSIVATGSSFLGSSILPGVISSTIIRTRGLFRMFLRTATAAGDGFQGAFGIGLASAAAIAAGVSSVPTPVTENDWDGWLFHHMVGVHSASAGSEVADQPAAEYSFEVDSKAMRRFEPEMGVYAMVEFVEIGTAVANIFFDSRTLIKLP